MALTGLQLRCPLSETVALTVKAPAGGAQAGALAQVGDVVGLFVTDALENERVALLIKAARAMVPSTPSPAGTGFSVGEKVYLDPVNAVVTESGDNNVLCGIVTRDAATGDQMVEIMLDGTLGITA